jgi:hypothetical protein
MENRKSAVFGEHLVLLGGRWSKSARVGQSLDVQLYWQAIRQTVNDYGLLFELVNSDGRSTVVNRHPISYYLPTSSWSKGDVFAEHYRLQIDPRSPPGKYTLRASPIDHYSTGILTPSNGPGVTLGEIDLSARPQKPPQPPFQRVRNTPFESGISLKGYSIIGEDGDAVPSTGRTVLHKTGGAPFKVVLHWQLESDHQTNGNLGGFDKSYTAFVQLLDSNGVLVSQHDGIPGDGLWPTTTWLSDETVVDPHEIVISPATSRGNYTIIAGLYDTDTIERLRTTSGHDHVVLNYRGYR